LCKRKTDAWPVPVILKLNFSFFRVVFNFCQNRFSCLLYGRPPVGASRRQAADNKEIRIIFGIDSDRTWTDPKSLQLQRVLDAPTGQPLILTDEHLDQVIEFAMEQFYSVPPVTSEVDCGLSLRVQIR
jgi:hypothetical protein